MKLTKHNRPIVLVLAMTLSVAAAAAPTLCLCAPQSAAATVTEVDHSCCTSEQPEKESLPTENGCCAAHAVPSQAASCGADSCDDHENCGCKTESLEPAPVANVTSVDLRPIAAVATLANATPGSEPWAYTAAFKHPTEPVVCTTALHLTNCVFLR